MTNDGIVEIDLSKGKTALVSSDDYEKIARWQWHFDGRYARGYPHGVKQYLHRYIMQPKPGEVVDHINGNRLDCRRSNMRNVPISINTSNQHGEPRNKLGLRGVYSTANGRYRAEIYYLGKRYALGTHPSAHAANAAYEEAKVRLHNGLSISG